MPIQLFPLLPKAAGFLQDGSLYQGDYCTDGQWVRFYQGKPKKIGGQLAIQKVNNNEYIVPPACKLITSIWLGGNLIYIAVTQFGIYSNITTSANPHQFTRIWKEE